MKLETRNLKLSVLTILTALTILTCAAGAATNVYLDVTAAELNTRIGQIPTNTATLSAGITTNFTFMSSTAVTGQVWYASGVLTNVDLNIGD